MVDPEEISLSLSSHTALITGASQGIGKAIAELFARLGARVIANYQDAEHFPSELASLPGVHAVEADISKPEAITKMFATCLERGLTPDILINNAGIYPRADPLRLSSEDWDAVQAVNLRGAFLCSQSAARLMMMHRRGCIVNITSDAPLKGPTEGAHYAASKAGVIALTRTLAKKLGAHGIRVNAIAPGLTDTAQPDLSAEERIQKAQRIPLGRVGAAQDVAKVALFLVTPLSEYITGQVLYVNGGATFA